MIAAAFLSRGSVGFTPLHGFGSSYTLIAKPPTRPNALDLESPEISRLQGTVKPLRFLLLFERWPGAVAFGL
jgi:hypothetical protein